MSNWSIDFSPMVPAPLFWAGAVLAVLLVGLLLFRRNRGAVLRALSLAALLLALSNPTLRQEERESLANIAIVVIDESTSQTIADRPEQAAAIRHELEGKLAGINNLQVRWVTSSRPTGETAAGTNLFSDLNSALANTPPDRLAGVIMITDGQVHDVPKSAHALGFDAPVHALLTGRPDEFDRRIEILKAPRYGIVGTTREIEARVVETGRRGRAGDRVSLRIRREGRADETRTTQIGRTVPIQMHFPHAGQNIVEIELETAAGELTPANNRVVVVAEGVRENLRVLLVSGEPHAGERVWRNLLKSDAAVDLRHGHPADGLPAPPVASSHDPRRRGRLEQEPGDRDVERLRQRGQRFERRRRLVVLDLAEVAGVEAGRLGHLGQGQAALVPPAPDLSPYRRAPSTTVRHAHFANTK